MAIYPLENVLVEVIAPSLAEIGEAWRNGRINVATEHLASAFVRQRLTMWLVTGPPAHPIRPIVLACAPNEWHEIGLLMLGVLLRRRRWPVAYLGQSVPLPDLAKFVRDIRPPIVVLVAMTDEAGQALLHLPNGCRRFTERPAGDRLWRSSLRLECRTAGADAWRLPGRHPAGGCGRGRARAARDDGVDIVRQNKRPLSL